MPLQTILFTIFKQQFVSKMQPKFVLLILFSIIQTAFGDCNCPKGFKNEPALGMCIGSPELYGKNLINQKSFFLPKLLQVIWTTCDSFGFSQLVHKLSELSGSFKQESLVIKSNKYLQDMAGMQMRDLVRLLVAL